MHSVKGAWVGQTFALAKSNESEGRKSRIRRSKEERKAMVESFIQKYQKLHNGNFPSLNLTHKEVGGSFYTVREIVRDLIQENRVLGPAKFAEENQSIHHLEEDPLGSIALEPPQYSLTILSNDSQSVENEHQSGHDELSTTSYEHRGTIELKLFDNGKFINGTPVDIPDKGLGAQKDSKMQGLEIVEAGHNADDNSDVEKCLVSDGNYDFTESEMINNGSLVDVVTKESHEVKNEESHEMNQMEPQVDAESKVENVGEESVSSMLKVAPMADVKVEMFPVRPVTKDHDLDGSPSEVIDKDHTFAKNETEKVELAAVGSPKTDRVNSSPSSIVVDVKEEDDATKTSSSEVTSATVISEQSEAIAGAKAVNAPNRTEANVDCNRGTNGQLKTEKEVGIQHKGSPQKESIPTLDRMNLDSWDGASKNPRRPQGNNPLWSVFKAFVDAFVKFWSE